jgi:hypothetical protein
LDLLDQHCRNLVVEHVVVETSAEPSGTSGINSEMSDEEDDLKKAKKQSVASSNDNNHNDPRNTRRIPSDGLTRTMINTVMSTMMMRMTTTNLVRTGR